MRVKIIIDVLEIAMTTTTKTKYGLSYDPAVSLLRCKGFKLLRSKRLHTHY